MLLRSYELIIKRKITTVTITINVFDTVLAKVSFITCSFSLQQLLPVYDQKFPVSFGASNSRSTVLRRETLPAL
jgi:hypothetical protein